MQFDEARVEKVARALCEAEGRDPDEEVPAGGLESVRQGNAIVQRARVQPLWKTMTAEAKRFIAAFDVLKAM